jgi:DNA-binding transcriptional LysR family regulator
MNIDLELYKVFYTVAKCRNISQAAELLYISQPAVSKSIKQLEELTSVTLFSRNSRGVKLTAEGLLFYDYIERAMKEISIGEDILDKLKNKEKGSIELSVSTTLCKHFLIPHLEEFINTYPNIKIKILNKTTFETLKLIAEGKIDFGIVSKPFELDHYNFNTLAEIQDTFVASKDYLDKCNIKNPNDIFVKCNFMLLEHDNITRKYVDNYLMENNISIKPEIEMNNMDFLIDFAKIGLGVSVVIKDFIKKELGKGTLIQIPVTPIIPKREVGIVYHKKIPQSIAAQTFQSFIFKKFTMESF